MNRAARAHILARLDDLARPLFVLRAGPYETAQDLAKILDKSGIVLPPSASIEIIAPKGAVRVVAGKGRRRRGVRGRPPALRMCRTEPDAGRAFRLKKWIELHTQRASG